MTFKEQEQFTKKDSDDLLTELSNCLGKNLISEIVRLGIQNLIELEQDEQIGFGNYEYSEDRRNKKALVPGMNTGWSEASVASVPT